MDFYDAGIDPHAIPTARQITRTRVSLNLNARVEASDETPAELSQLRDSEIRPSNPEPWQIWTLPDFIVIDDNVTIMPDACDCYMIDPAGKFINQGLSLQNNQSPTLSDLLVM